MTGSIEVLEMRVGDHGRVVKVVMLGRQAMIVGLYAKEPCDGMEGRAVVNIEDLDRLADLLREAKAKWMPAVTR